MCEYVEDQKALKDHTNQFEQGFKLLSLLFHEKLIFMIIIKKLG
jgi:hypothetical protein